MQFTMISGPLDPVEGAGTSMLHTVLSGSVPLPAATRADSKLMHHVAALMHSSTSRGHGIAATLLPGSLFLKTPRITVYATAAQNPLFLGEIEVVAIATGHPVILLRRTDGSTPDLTVDVALPGSTDPRWFLDYRLFRSLSGDSWLVPFGCGPLIHLMQHGLFLTEHAPYADAWDRDAGIDRAGAHLASHRIGGWSW